MRCCCLYPDQLGPQASAGLLPLRVAMGVAFVLHGLPKVQNAFAWMGSESPVPGVFQARRPTRDPAVRGRPAPP